MCGGGSPRAPKEPVVRPPQVLRNPLLDDRLGLANLGIGSLTMRAGDKLSFSAGGSVLPNLKMGTLRPGSAQGTGKFTPLIGGLTELRAEKQRRLEATEAYQREQQQKSHRAAIERQHQRESRLGGGAR